MNNWKDVVDDWHPTGSNYTCDPPVEDTDIDYVCYVNNVSKVSKLLSLGYSLQQNYGNVDSDFYNLRKDKINLIITENMTFYLRFVQATEEAKKLNLLDKQERIALFESVMSDV